MYGAIYFTTISIFIFIIYPKSGIGTHPKMAPPSQDPFPSGVEYSLLVPLPFWVMPTVVCNFEALTCRRGQVRGGGVALPQQRVCTGLVPFFSLFTSCKARCWCTMCRPVLT